MTFTADTTLKKCSAGVKLKELLMAKIINETASEVVGELVILSINGMRN